MFCAPLPVQSTAELTIEPAGAIGMKSSDLKGVKRRQFLDCNELRTAESATDATVFGFNGLSAAFAPGFICLGRQIHHCLVEPDGALAYGGGRGKSHAAPISGIVCSQITANGCRKAQRMGRAERIAKTSKPTSNQEVLDASPEMMAEVVSGTPYKQPRPAKRHAWASSGIATKISPPFNLAMADPAAG